MAQSHAEDHHAAQHVLEFGGSPVSTEFAGRLKFELSHRIPVIAVSRQFLTSRV